MDIRHHDFLELVKRTRERLGVSIDEAHAHILAQPAMRRLAASRINRDPKCRALANSNLRRLGDRALFVREGDHLRLR